MTIPTDPTTPTSELLPARKPTLDELFAKLKPTPSDKARDTRRLFGQLKANRFAVLFVKHGFRAENALHELYNDMGRKWVKNSRKSAAAYARSASVAKHVRAIVQGAMQQAQMDSIDDLQQMMQVNRAIIYGDIVDLVEEVRVANEDGTFRKLVQLRPLASLTRPERLMVKKIRFHRTGEVASIEAYDRLDAERTQLMMLDILKARGGSDQDWMHDFTTRIKDARAKRIAIEVKNGKVVELHRQRAS